MKQVFKLILIFSMIFGAGLQGMAEGSVTNVTPQAGEWLKKAYQSVVDAELARADNHTADAIKSYQQALGFYDRLKTDYPGWQSSMINFRVSECQNALTVLAIPQEPVILSNRVVEAEMKASNTVERLQSLVVELRNVQATLTLVNNSVDEAQSKQLLAEVSRLKGELSDAAKSNQLMQRKIGKLEAKLKKAEGGLDSDTNAPCRAVVAAVKSEASRLIKANDTVPAIALLMEAVELMPAESDLVIQLAVANCRDGRFDEAVKLLAPFDVWRAKNADALLTLGTAYMGLGEVGKARDAMEKSLAIKPDSAEAHYNMAQILLTVSPPDVPKAQEHYQRAIELGSSVDLEFENALRTALIITRMKKHSAKEVRQRPRTTSGDIRTIGAKSGTP